MVFQVTQHNRRFPVFFQVFGGIAKFDRSVAKKITRSPNLFCQLLIFPRDIFFLPFAARHDRQYSELIQAERFTRLRKMVELDPKDQQHFLLANLTRMIGHPECVLIFAKRILKFCDSDSRSPLPQRIVGRNSQRNPHRGEDDFHGSYGRTETNGFDQVDAHGDHGCPELMSKDWKFR